MFFEKNKLPILVSAAVVLLICLLSFVLLEKNKISQKDCGYIQHAIIPYPLKDGAIQHEKEMISCMQQLINTCTPGFMKVSTGYIDSVDNITYQVDRNCRIKETYAGSRKSYTYSCKEIKTQEGKASYDSNREYYTAEFADCDDGKLHKIFSK